MIFYFIKIIFTRSYKYLLLTFFSLLMGAFLFGSIISLSQSLSLFFKEQGKTLIGGDIVMSSANQIDVTNQFFTALRNEGHTLITEYRVQAVFRSSTGSSTSPAMIRAVENEFPLYGKVVLEDNALFVVGGQRIFVDRPFLDTLQLRVGDTVFVGTSSFTIAGVLLQEPDAVSFGVSFVPKVIIAKDDLLKSGIGLAQSRVSHKVLIRQRETNPFTNTQVDAVKAYAKENKLRFDDARDGPNNLVRGLSSVEDFAGIVLAIALFLVAVNIGANLAYILSRFKKTIALLKTFGATTSQIQKIYSSVLGLIGFVAGSLGALLGAQGANMLLPELSSYVDGVIPSTKILPTALLGGLSGFGLIIISSIPFFNSLKDIVPKQLLSNIAVTGTKRTIYSFLAYIPLPLFLALLLYGFSKNIYLTAYSIFALMFMFSFFMAISYAIITYLYKNRTHFSFIFSSIISFLKWRGLETVVTSAAIMTALSGVFIVSAIEENIIYNIQGSLSKSAPALYLVDITTSQLPKVKELAGPTFQEYPIIRGRLLMINDRDMTTSSDGNITREFNMTYRSSLIDGESIVSGVWHGTSQSLNAVSFEKSFGDDVGGVRIGDVVTVFIQGITVKASVTSIHEADKSRGTPFFYMVFSLDVLNKFPSSYFGTVEGTPETINKVEDDLGGLFPNIIPIQTGKVLETVKSLLNTIILVVKIVGIPSILLGLMLVLIMTGQSLYERKGDVLVLRVFGLTKNTIMYLFIAEAGVLILIATSISYAIAHLVAYVLNRYLFSFDFFSFAMTPLYISAGILLVTVVVSYYISSSLINTPLKKLLAEK